MELIRKDFLPWCKPLIGKEEIQETIDTLKSGWLTKGPKTERFEKELASSVKSKYAIALTSGTAALHLSLLALGIGKGDEVITSPFTFTATSNMVIQTGAKPVLVDIKKDTFNIDVEKIREAITQRTKAILPIHYAGHPCDMKTIQKIARLNGLKIIDDAAHAIGAEYRGKPIGSFCNATCFSFYPTKLITMGEGGAITTNNKEVAKKIKLLRNHGVDSDVWKRCSSDIANWGYDVVLCGLNYVPSDIQASVGIHQLRKLDYFIKIRRKYAKIYNEELEGIKGVIVPTEKPNVKHAYYLYSLLLENYNRDKFIKEMKKRNIECFVHVLPLHLFSFYRKRFGFKKGDFPNAEWVFEREVSLPLYPKMNLEDVRDVIDATKEILK